MSKYTTEVRYICENAAGLTESNGYNSVNQTLDACWENVFNFEFPIFDETYRGVLCKKILKHYYTREIAQETVGLWRLRLDTRLNEIMPYYNKLYESELLTFNPLYDIDVTTTHEKTGKSDSVFGGNYTDVKDGSFEESNESTNKKTTADTKSTNTEESVNTTNEQTTTDTGSLTGKTTSELSAVGSTDKTSKETTKYSDTPQGALTNVEDGTYLTNATIKEGSENVGTTDTQNGEVNNTQNSTNNGTVEGKGSESKTGKVSDTFDGLETTNVSGSKSGKNNENGTRTSAENTTVNSTEDYVTKVLGKSNGALSYAKMLMEFRDSFLNIDMMIINDLGELFFGLW